MLLCIEIGNSRTHWGLFKEGKLGRHGTCPAAEGLPDLAAIAGEGVQRLLLASVAPSRTERLAQEAETTTGVRAEVIGKDLSVPIPARVDHPERVGADRLLGALAAYRRAGGACVVVDAGTAVTVDLVDASGAFCGGAIAPGPGLLMESMERRAELLPEVRFAKPASAVGKNTADAMRSGAFWGAVGAVRELIRRVAAEADGPCRVLGTGGWMDVLAPHLPALEAVVPCLTLEGMAIAACKMQSGAG